MGGSEVDGHRRLAHAALARGNAVDPGQAVRLGEGDLALGIAAAQVGPQLGPLLVAHDPEGHGGGGDALDGQ